MKKSIFSRGLFVEGLRQLRIFGFIFLALFMVVEIGTPVLQYLDFRSYSAAFNSTVQAVTFLDIFPIIIIVPVIIAPIMVLTVFSCFNKRNSSDFYHSLPYTRICIFTSFLAAVFTWIFAICIISGATGIILHMSFPQLFVVSLTGTFDILFSIFAMTLLVVASITAAMSVTGTVLANITVSGLILFLPRILIFFITNVISSSLMPIIKGIQTYSFLDLRYNVLVNFVKTLLTGGSEDPLSGNIACDIYTCAVAVLIGIIAAILFCKRSSETAGNSAPGRKTQATIRIAIAMVPCTLITCFLITGELEIGWAVMWYVISLIIYFAYELITTKRWSMLPKAMPGVLVLFILNLLVVGIVYGGAAAVASYNPSAADVSSIRIIQQGSSGGSGSYTEFSEYAEKKSIKLNIKDADAIEAATKALSASIQACKDKTFDYGNFYNDNLTKDATYINLAYVSKNGMVHNRNVCILNSDMDKIISAINKVEDYNKNYTNIPNALERTLTLRNSMYGTSPEVSSEALLEVLASLQSEIKEIDFEKWYNVLRGSIDTINGYESTYIYYTAEETMEKIAVPIYSTVTPKTYQLLLDKIYDSSKALVPVITDILSDLDSAAKKYESFDISIYCKDVAADKSKTGWSINTYKQNANTADGYKAAVKELSEAIKNTTSNISSEAYMKVFFTYSYTEDDKYKFVEHNIMLPRPDNFTPNAQYFEFITNDEYLKG